MLRPHRRLTVTPTESRRGSTLLIVLALMGMLAVLGFLFYTFAAQEHAAATSTSDEARVLIAPGLEPEELFDIALEQLALGPSERKVHSALWGARHALATNMLGGDGIPFNGEGVHLIDDGNGIGIPAVDQNYDATAEGSLVALREPNDSPAANAGNLWQLGSAKDPTNVPQTLPQPDVEYTYPDINHMFLAYRGQAVDAGGGTRDVVIPSLHRPQYLRTVAGYEATWKTHPTANFHRRSLRPHPAHQTLDVGSLPPMLTIPSSTIAWTAPVTGSGNKPVYRFFGPDGAPGAVGVNDDGDTITDFDPMTGEPDWDEVDSTNAANDDFPFRGPRVNGTTQALSEGVWDPSSGNLVRYDLDLDGDGIREAILVDLDVPAHRRGDGKLVYPMFAFTVYDANGLINLNATGNLAGLLDQYRSNLGGNQRDVLALGTHELGSRLNGATGGWESDSLSRSNQGLSTYEINPTRALTATPTDTGVTGSAAAMNLRYVLLPFGYPSTQLGRSRSELANLEWLSLLSGRPRFHPQLAQAAGTVADLVNAGNTLIAGRNGDISQLPAFLLSGQSGGNSYLLPGAGTRTQWNTGVYPYTPLTTPGTDDNLNQTFGENTNDRFMWPLDLAGSGRWHRRYDWGADGMPGFAGADDDGNGIVDDIGEEGWQGSDDVATTLPYVANYRYTSGATNRLLWPKFSGYSRAGASGVGARWGDSGITGAVSTQLVPAPPADPLVDEPAESLFEPEILSSSFSLASAAATLIGSDAVFGVEENSFLQTGQFDLKNQARRKSRLAELAPANFVESDGAASIRQRFTTMSSDRREIGWSTPTIGGLNSWETTTYGGFPPVANRGTGAPMRGDLFQMLRNDPASGPAHRLKLNLNRLLTNDGTRYLQRRLTPFTPGTSPWAASQTQAVSERVNMARDIYTLLYLFSSGSQLDYLATPGTPQRSAEECQQMAQFAVNLVDALDTDDVVTQFNYDSDLSDGTWSPPGGSTEVVFGVERQLLTISEGLAFRVQPDTTPNNNATIFDDTQTNTTYGRRYGYVELQNVTPVGVTLASSSANSQANAEWRILLVQPAAGMTPETALKAAYLQSGLNNAQNGLTVTALGNQLAAGSVFSIGSQDGSDTISGSEWRTSDFRADIDLDGKFDRIVPIVDRNGATTELPDTPQTSTPSNQFPVPACNLDLCYNYSTPWSNPANDTSRYIIANPVVTTDLTSDNYTPVPNAASASAGAFVQDIVAGMTQVKFVLQRRATGTLWATVDTFTTDVKTANLATTPATTASVQSEITDIILSDRRQKPLDRATRIPTTSGDSGSTAKLNTFNRANVSSSNNLWQWHLDRDFALIGELLLLPVTGPDDVTAGNIALYPNGMMLYDVIDDTRTDSSTGNTYTVKTARTAAGFFRNPLLPQLTAGTAPSTAWTNGNRWHRLLQFLEVPPRDHRHVALTGNPDLAVPTAGSTSATSPYTAAGQYAFEPWNYPIGFGWPRKHGALNLNTIRHSPVWGALLDDVAAIPGIGSDTPSYNDGVEGANRDWWQQLLKSRDGVNGTADPLTNVFLPGTVFSRPFRDWGFASRGAQSVEETALRSLAADAISGNPTLLNRHLMELGQNSDHLNPENNLITPAARHRLLAKILNNTTTRSNTFFVFVGVQFHEAAEIDVGSGKRALRIGRKIDEMPVHRGFFVVDRSPLVDQVRTLKGLGVSSLTSTTSFRYVQDTNNGSIPNGLRWRDTVLFRQILN